MSEERYASWNSLSVRFLKISLKYLLVHISRMWLLPPHLRPLLLRLCGHKFKDRKNVFIGADVLFDNVLGARTHVGKNVTITNGTKIMNHFLEPSEHNQKYSVGDVHLEDGVFLGMNVLIVKPIRIGENTVVSAGSVVINDIPGGVIAGGVPAMVKKRIDEN